MFRNRVISEVKYGHYAEFYEIFEELNKVVAQKGLRSMTLWAPYTGPMNQVIMESEYPDLATLDRDVRQFQADPDCMKLWRRAGEITVQGSTHTEVLEEAYQIA